MPRTAILNNLEFDHADIFPDLAAIERQFHHFVRTVPRSGLIVANGADEALARVLAGAAGPRSKRFGVADGWQAGEPDAAGGVRGRSGRASRWAACAGRFTGAHNRLNALAAIAAARHVGVEPAAAHRRARRASAACGGA